MNEDRANGGSYRETSQRLLLVLRQDPEFEVGE
jgi:hypothetical protein